MDLSMMLVVVQVPVGNLVGPCVRLQLLAKVQP